MGVQAVETGRRKSGRDTAAQASVYTPRSSEKPKV